MIQPPTASHPLSPIGTSGPITRSQWHLDDSDGSQFSDEPLDDVLGAITTFSPTEAPIADLVAAVHKRATEDLRCTAPDMLTHVSYRVTPSGKASVETFCAPSDDIVNRNGELTITDDVAGLSDPSSAAAGDGAVTIDRPLNLLQTNDMRTLLHYAGAFFGDTLTSIEVQPPANLSDGVPGCFPRDGGTQCWGQPRVHPNDADQHVCQYDFVVGSRPSHR